MIYALLFASGATALVFQVAWMRDLLLVFGAHFEAQSIVLATLMAGIAAGGFGFGLRADRLARPLRTFGLLQIVVAAFALASPWLLQWVDAAFLAIATRAGDSGAGTTAARAALAFALLLLPTLCMGATLPVLVRTCVRRYDEFGERLSRLYATQTLGAAIGTLLAGFVLLPGLGVRRSELLAALASVVIGAVAIGLGRRAPATPPAEASGLPAPANGLAGWPFRLAFWGAAVAGMGLLALGVSWWRTIAIATGARTYDFTVMWAAILGGIALGSALHGRVARGRFGVPVRSGVALAALGVTSALASMLIPRLPELALRIAAKLPGGALGVRTATSLAVSLLVTLVPCLLVGIAFPLAAEARARLDPRFGRSVGDLVASNTVGAMLGSLLAGFVGIPWLGLQRTILLVSAACLGWGLVVLCAAWAARRREWRGLAWAGALAALPAAAGIALALPRWDLHALTGIPNNDVGFLLNADGEIDVELTLARTRLVSVEEGRGSTVSVVGAERGSSLLIDGRVVATDSLDDLQTRYLLGHLPVLLHPQPRSAIVMGLGAGLTLGGVAADERLERIVVVEAEPAVRHAAQLFAELHDDAVADLRVELVWQDARNHLETTRERFDVITSAPSQPSIPGAGYLYTTEYYRILADHLSPGGIACQWLPLQALGEEELRSAVASFVITFAHVTLWHSAGDALLIGSDAPIGIDLDALAARLRIPRVARQLARVGLDDPLSLLAEFVMDRAAMERLSDGVSPHTDDNLRLEFSTSLAIGSENARNRSLIDAEQADVGALIRNAGSRFTSKQELQSRLASFHAAKAALIRGGPRSEGPGRLPAKARWSALAAYHREILEREPEYRPAKVRLAACLAGLGEALLEEGNSAAALQRFREALEIDPGNAVANLHFGLEWSKRQPKRALAHFEAASERAPLWVEAQVATAQAQMSLKQFWEALDRLRIAETLRPDGAEIHRLSCVCLRRIAQPEAAVEKCREAQSHAPGDVQIAIELAYTLQSAGNHRDAADTLRHAFEADPRRLAVRLRLAWLLSTSPDPAVRDGARALELVSAAAQRSQNPRILDVLAAALAESGRFEEAATAAAHAAMLADAGGHPGLAERIRAHEAAYEAQRPLREDP
jgi:spermidine synthase